MSRLRCYAIAACAVLALALIVTPTPSQAEITYQDIVLDGSSGIEWERTPSPRLARRQAIVDQSPIPNADFGTIRTNESPQKGWGNPGVGIFDYDNDGDLDIYVPNGPGTANSLFANQYANGGGLTFVDVGVTSGADATAQDSAAVCAGDIDNDGDQDLYVLGTGEANIFFENNGDGTFTDVTDFAGVAGDGRHAVGCSFGDVDNDGYLDVVVGNSYDDWGHRIPVFTIGPTYDGMEHNYLFHNQGDGSFADVSEASGIQEVSNMPAGAFTWAIAMVDYDQDGDIDIVSADNQGGTPQDETEERGYNRIFQNDGAGNFTDVTFAAGLNIFGGWMGLDFADLNCDGYLDFFSTNLGYLGAGQPSRWFLGGPGGVFTDPGIGDLGMTPFGWGTSMLDYDNDGDADIIYHGGVDILSVIDMDNPGVLLENEGNCTADFRWAEEAFTTEHINRTVHGVAVGDLNHDGFEDIVSVSNFNIGEIFAVPYVGTFFPPFDSPFDPVSLAGVGFSSRVTSGFQTYLDPEIVPGSLSVEISSADNGNGWVEVHTAGSYGVINDGTVNRDGIGAVVSFTPRNGTTAIRPIIGGSSYSSQDALAANFGLGTEKRGTVDVLWPGGVRNRLYNVRSGSVVTFPEIPCSYDSGDGFLSYLGCLRSSLNGLSDAGVISRPDRARFLLSGIRAYFDN
ncbi:MAG: CRTAC1 family protein [Acidobacteriota bacterium]